MERSLSLVGIGDVCKYVWYGGQFSKLLVVGVKSVVPAVRVGEVTLLHGCW